MCSTTTSSSPSPAPPRAIISVSGLVPVLLLVATAAVYPRLRAGGRAVVAMTLGALGVAIGAPAAYFLRNGGMQGDHYTGLLAGVAGVVLLITGPGHPVAQPTYRRQPRTALPAPHAGGCLRSGARSGDRVVPGLPDRRRVHLHAHRSRAGRARPAGAVRERRRHHRRRARADGHLRAVPEPGGGPALPGRRPLRGGAHAPGARVRGAAARSPRTGRQRRRHRAMGRR